jgi:hypothetical protein
VILTLTILGDVELFGFSTPLYRKRERERERERERDLSLLAMAEETESP